MEAFRATYNVPTYGTLEEVIADHAVQLVENLTSPPEHYGITRAAFEAGKHVCSEKPLAMDMDEARHLVEMSRETGLHLAPAPASLMGEAAQTLWRAVRERRLGAPRLVYAELDDGMVHRSGYERWKTKSGAYWPAEDEFRTGCTMEHAGYALTWLVGMFGPARHVVSAGGCRVQDMGTHTPDNYTTPDFTVATLCFDNGVMARMTNSILAPHDHRFRVICDDGRFEVEELWDFKAKVREIPLPKTRVQRKLQKVFRTDGGRTVPPVRTRSIKSAKAGYPMDFCAGIAELASALMEDRTPRLTAEFGLHITELSLAIQHPEQFGTAFTPTTTLAPIEPMEWAKA